LLWGEIDMTDTGLKPPGSDCNPEGVTTVVVVVDGDTSVGDALESRIHGQGSKELQAIVNGAGAHV
jgi:hypothetical protein